MKVTVLMENTALEGCGLTPEHGLSLYIEYRGRKLLLDAGATEKFADNAQALGVDLAAVELAVLSHGHNDHAGGLGQFFRLNRQAPVYICAGAAGPVYAEHPDGRRFIGIDREVWTQFQSRFTEVEGTSPLTEGVWLVPDTLRDPAFTGRATNLLYQRGEDDFIPDDFRHEQSLVLEEERGLVVFNSCSHTGIVNIVRGVLEQFPGKKVFAVVGGLHMFGRDHTGLNCTPEYVYQVADTLKKLGVEEIYTGHCTGEMALSLLRERFGPGCHALSTGKVLTL